MSGGEAEDREVLVRYLQAGRDAMVWKLDGLSEYDARRPLTSTGTNLLGLVQHLASVELGYFVDTFGREMPVSLPWWSDDADPNQDMWVAPDRSRTDVLDLYRLAWAEGDRVLAEVGLDGEGRVPWWPDSRNPVTLRTLLVHLVAETHRHAGHADILRESLDGAAGMRPDNSNLPDDEDWPAYVEKVEQAAREAR